MAHLVAVLLLAVVSPAFGRRNAQQTGGGVSIKVEGELSPHKSSTEEKAFPDFQPVSREEESLISDMVKPIFPEGMGRGHDVRKERQPYNRLEFVAAWKPVDTYPHLQSYLQRLNQSNAGYKSQNRQFSVHTVNDSWQENARRIGILRENEYLLFRGASPKRMGGFFSGGIEGRGTVGTFGKGIYLADAVDKMDQYVRDDEDESLQYLEKLVGTQDEQAKKLRNSSNIKLGVIVRTYLGHHIELAYEHLVCKRKPLEEHERMWYYRDPETNVDKEVHDTPADRFNRTPPFQDFDSLKIMSRILEPKFFEGIQPGLAPSFIPLKYNEYLINDEDHVAAYYIVAYKRNFCDTEACKQDDAKGKKKSRLPGDSPCREDYDRSSVKVLGRSKPTPKSANPSWQKQIYCSFLSLFGNRCRD